MPHRYHLSRPVWSRRQALRLSMALGASVALGIPPLRPASAQGTPSATAVVDRGYARPEGLVSADWLHENLDDPALVVVGFMPSEEFEAARVPGAVQINAPELEVIDTSDDSIQGWQEETQRLLGGLGISPESTVVTYDDGTLFSARLWWILHYFGHENVHVLDGGLDAWRSIDGEVESGAFDAPVGGEAYAGTPNDDLLAQLDEVMERLDDESVVIIDARTPEEHAEGHIPGAVNLNFPLNAAPDPPKFWKPADELEAMYTDIGATADRLVIPYCASGVRSAVTAFTLHLLGYDDVALYTGSWLEWGEHPDTPKETGEEP